MDAKASKHSQHSLPINFFRKNVIATPSSTLEFIVGSPGQLRVALEAAAKLVTARAFVQRQIRDSTNSSSRTGGLGQRSGGRVNAGQMTTVGLGGSRR